MNHRVLIEQMLSAMDNGYMQRGAHENYANAMSDALDYLAAPEQSEPVAYIDSKMVHGSLSTFIYRTDNTKHLPDGMMLYAHPAPQPTELTDEEISATWDGIELSNGYPISKAGKQFARAVLAAQKAKV